MSTSFINIIVINIIFINIFFINIIFIIIKSRGRGHHCYLHSALLQIGGRVKKRFQVSQQSAT